MLLVEGGYCPEVFHQCLDYEPERGSLPSARCRRYAEPAECASARVPMRFCIDRVEYSATEAELPDNRQSLLDATQACQSTGKRLCRDDEWTFACEGEAMQPYPYGFALNDSACGTGRTDLMDSRGKLSDHRRVRGSLERCASPFGVRDLAGNLEEHVVRAELPADVRRLPREQSVLKGAWWQPGDHRCRAGQTAHDQFYKGTETGFRCCKQPAAGAT
jgi:formylglycine-generating enzyme required for sulfatase activity